MNRPPRGRRSGNSRWTESNIAGVLPVFKPAGPTSHDIVQIARKALNERAIGHTGTLDPAAEGLLLLCIGPYTKLVPFLTESDKTYSGEIGLGIETTTDDREGAPTLIADCAAATEERVRNFAQRFVGDIEQIPPRYAAVKIDGKKLYEYARENQEVHVDPRPVTVHSFNIFSMREAPFPAEILARTEEGRIATTDLPRPEMKFRVAQFETRVSSGTYVRALARDLGRELGCGGYLASLVRTAVGRYDSQNAISVEELRENPAAADQYLIRGSNALDPSRYSTFPILRGFQSRLIQGQPIMEKMLEDPTAAANVKSGAVVGISSDDGALLAIMQAERFEQHAEQNVYGTRFLVHFKPLRIFPTGLK